jgi:alkyl hydroperoxide reductase subunit F
MYDLIIVGGGPAGISAGIYASRKKIKTLLITDTFGGQSIVSDKIENWIGEKEISGYDLAKKLENHLKSQEGIEILENDLVIVD